MAFCKQEWQWEDDDGFKPFKGNVSSELDKLDIGECYTLHLGNKQYEIKKVSNTKCVQRNTQTDYTRNVMLRGPKGAANKTNSHWYWKDDKDQLHAYSDDISAEIESLQVDESYFVFFNNKQYQITKINKYKCKQTNTETGFSRDVISKNGHKNTNASKCNNNNTDDFGEDKWHWIDDKNQYNAFDDIVSQRIDDLDDGESMMHNTKWAQYKITKLSKYKGQQRNTDSNKVREIRKMNQNHNGRGHGHQHRHKYHVNKYHSYDNDDEKQAAMKWYFKDDNDDFKPMDDCLCIKINNLTIGDITTQKIRNTKYEFKRTSIRKGTQRNTDSNKTREISMAEYGWFYEDHNKDLQPYSDELNKKMDKLSINGSFTFKVTKHNYSVTKLSKNTAKQKNLSTKVERDVVRKMILNETDHDHHGHSRGESHGDWLERRYSKAMKSGKIEKVTLSKRRTLSKSSADFHFRICESQFMRSCDKMGKESNGQNSSIKEVEYVINPALIKKFETKKKKLMKKNKCGEDGLNIILAWHGTPKANLDTITKNNFDISKLGVNKKNTGYYGCGIYFSEFVRISKNYGDGMLLCKVICGKEYKMAFGKPEIGRNLEPGYDSHVAVKPNSEYGREVCIYDVDQILPCYIVKF